MKKIVQSIKGFSPAGEATPAAPLGTMLGQVGVNIAEFITRFNAESLQTFERGVPLAFVAIRNPKDKTYKIFIKGVTTTTLLDNISFFFEGKEYIRPENLFDIIRIKQKFLSMKGIHLSEQVVASILFSSLDSFNSKIIFFWPPQLRKWRKKLKKITTNE